MADLSLADLVLPYLFRGENLGATHAALSVLRVVTFESAVDDLGVTLRGHCEVNGSLELLPASGALVAGDVDEAAPAHDPSRSDPVFDLRDTTVDFELFVPRQGSSIVRAAEASLPAGGDLLALLGVWNFSATPSDYPATGFVFDLIVNAPKIRPPFLHPAKVSAIGVLEPDTSVREVAITLPRMRFRLSHGNADPSQLVLALVSAGVSDLDDPGSTGVAQLISMEPPYAYIGGADDHTLGIGFRSATLDLDNDWTPPALREKAGVGDDWTGLYLPEVRVFVAPDGLRNLAFECGAQELLIGMGPTGGIWGDFDAALVQQGSGELHLLPRFAGPEREYVVERGAVVAGIEQATARVPEHSTLVVDVRGGRTPYTRVVRINGTAQPAAMAYDLDLSATGGTATVDLEVTSATGSGAGGGSGPPTARMHLVVQRLSDTVQVITPGTSTTTGADAAITTESGFDFDLSPAGGNAVTLTTLPRVEGLVWKEGGTLIGSASAAITVDVAGAATRTFTAQRPGGVAGGARDFYFFFNNPGSSTDPSGEMSTTRATDKFHQTWTPGHADPISAFGTDFAALGNGAAIIVLGDASREPGGSDLQYNTALAYRRAVSARDAIQTAFAAKGFHFTLIPDLSQGGPPTAAQQTAWQSASGWNNPDHVAPFDRDHWRAVVTLPAGTPAQNGSVTVHRDAPTTTTTPPVVRVIDPPVPETSPPPDWFRSAKVLVRIVDSALIALQLDLEVDIQTAVEGSFERRHAENSSAPLPPAPIPRGRTLDGGTPVGPDNPADGITAMRVLVQTDPATGRWDTLLRVGADPADTDGLYHVGWIPQVDPMPAGKDLGVTFLGSYVSFWPLLAAAPPVDAARALSEGRDGAVGDAALSVAAMAVPAIVAALPWFSVERVILFGAEYFHTQRDGGFTGTLLFDLEADWSVDLLGIVKIKRESPLKVRYKAIGLRLTNRDADPPPPPGATDLTRWDFLPVFDSSRGFTIDLASGGGGMTIADPLGQILRIAGARLSRSNPMTLEVDINLGVDLGVVSVDQASVRAYLDEPRMPELTALSAGVDIPGALVGSGYMRIGTRDLPDGTTASTIGGQIDLTLRPVNLRIAAALEIATITDGPRTATGVYIGLNVVLPVGIPLGTTGLGIFGFRGIFGMHYHRREITGPNASAPALEWLKAAQGQPHLLKAPGAGGQVLWEPKIDNWAFGVGILIGTMEGGVLINLDGTLLLELPGPRVLIMMKARILSPPPSMDAMGNTGGVLAVLEITPEHFLIGIIVEWEIERVVKIVIPVEAVFPFGANSDAWHIYLGARSDYGPSIEVDVLGIVKGTGYLMFRGNGVGAFNNGHATLPEIKGFAIALGVAASFTWGDVDDGLYLRIGGGMDAVLGFDPFILAGNIYVAGELRLWVVSVGADASLTVIVTEQPGSPGSDGLPDLAIYVHGRACGHVDLFFFEVSGCVDIEISGPKVDPTLPSLVEKVSLQSRSPALAQGSGVDRPIDASLGEATAVTGYPGDGAVPWVPIDAIPVISMTVPPVPDGAVVVAGLGPVTTAPGVDSGGWAERSSERYHYAVKAVRFERIKGNGQVDPQTFVSVSDPVPPVWWSLAPADTPNPGVQLALLTWQATPATKAIEYTDKLVEQVRHRWAHVCSPAADPAEVLWTFKIEPLGPSATGWDLEGIAWPDDPGTRRGAAPDTELRVSEPWRSGDAQLDALRGVVPAVVLGGVVECERTKKPVRLGDLTHLEHSVADVGHSFEALRPPRVVIGGLGPVDDAAPQGEMLPVDDPVRRLVSPLEGSSDVRISTLFHRKATAAVPGLRDLAATANVRASLDSVFTAEAIPARPFTRLTMDRGLLSLLDLDALHAGRPVAEQPSRTDSPPAASGSRCPVKVLQSPLLDNGLLTTFPDPGLEKLLKAAKVPTHEDSELVDLVHLHTDGFEQLYVLLLLPPDGRRKVVQVVARVLDVDGGELDRVEVQNSDLLDAGAVLPEHWTRLSGPWGNDIADLLRWTQERKLQAAIVKVPSSADAAIVEIGRRRSEGERQLPAVWYLAAAGMIRTAEVVRADWDTTQIASDRERLVSATGPDASKHPLLVPDSRYRVSIDWYALRQSGGTRASSAVPETQVFWFHTDKIAAAPADPVQDKALVFTTTPAPTPVNLDAWLMMTLPSGDELGVFTADPLRLVFNTHDVDRMFAAYGKVLRLRLEASSGRHPDDSDAGPLPLTLDTSVVKAVSTPLISPWNKAIDVAIAKIDADSADGSSFCVEGSGDNLATSEVKVQIPLERHMGYLLDVECVDAGAAASVRGARVLRRHFTTGGFASLKSLAWSVASTQPGARSAEAGTFASMWAALGARPQGNAVDGHLLAHHLEPLGPPEQPRVVVFWEQVGSAAPQPVAVMVDATEPLVRSRDYPHELVDTTVPDAPTRWVMAPREWLTVGTGGDPNVVRGVVTAPGAQRVFVVLQDGQRGKHLKIDLVAPAMPDLPFLDTGEQRAVMVDVTLAHAPWEEV